MKTCTVKHRSAATRAKCPICGKNNRKTQLGKPQTLSSLVDDSMRETRSDFRDAWKKKNPALVLGLASKPSTANKEVAVTDKLARSWFKAANLFNYSEEDNIRKYGEEKGSQITRNIERQRDELKSYFTPIDGYVTRGIKTDESFDKLSDLDEYVEDMAMNNKQMLFKADVGYPMRDDSLLSCSSSPVIASCFAKGANIIEHREIAKLMEGPSGKKHSGYILRIEDTEGCIMPDDEHLGERSEQEVIVAADDLELVEFQSSRKSGWGMPVLVYRGNK